MKLILASNNKNKLRELRELMSDTGIEILSQSEAGCNFEVEENGTTFAENAYLKAEAVYKATGHASLADDSGLAVDALDGAPGIYSARFAPGGHSATDYERNVYLLSVMENVEHRDAKFVCSICCIMPGGDIIRTEEYCYGDIIREQRGSGGFGYNTVFRPKGYDITMAEMSDEERYSISHRGKALREFKKKLREYNDTKQ